MESDTKTLTYEVHYPSRGVVGDYRVFTDYDEARSFMLTTAAGMDGVNHADVRFQHEFDGVLRDLERTTGWKPGDRPADGAVWFQIHLGPGPSHQIGMVIREGESQ